MNLPDARRRALLVGAAMGAFPVAAGARNAAVQEALARLGTREAAVLGDADVQGDFNDVALAHGLHRTGPRSRDFSIKTVWAAERRCALFTGANHNSPHRLNDVWQFDLGDFGWRLLYPPDHPRSYGGLGPDASDVAFENGWLITRRGGPAVIGHTWSGLTYDPVRQQLLFMNTWIADQDKLVRELGGDPQQRYRGPPLWSFTPHTGRWSPIETPKPWPAVPFGAMLEYVPALEGAIWHMNNWQMRGTWLFESRARRWHDLRANAAGGDFERQAPGRELVGYHDPRRGLIVARQAADTFHFEVQHKRWTRVATSGDPAPEGHDAHTALHYDDASGDGLLVDLRGRGMWAYDPDNARWARLTPQGSPMPGGERPLVAMDPTRNVLLFIADRKVWAYRHLAKAPAR